MEDKLNETEGERFINIINFMQSEGMRPLVYEAAKNYKSRRYIEEKLWHIKTSVKEIEYLINNEEDE